MPDRRLRLAYSRNNSSLRLNRSTAPPMNCSGKGTDSQSSLVNKICLIEQLELAPHLLHAFHVAATQVLADAGVVREDSREAPAAIPEPPILRAKEWRRARTQVGWRGPA